MKDVCYWELFGKPDNLRAKKWLLVIDDNNIAKYKFDLTMMELHNEVNSYADFLQIFPEPHYPYKNKEEKK